MPARGAALVPAVVLLLVSGLVGGVAPGAPAAAAAADRGPLLLGRAGAGLGSLDVPLDDRLARTSDGRWRTGLLRTSSFSMLGVTWLGGDADADPGVRVRVRTSSGWRPWQPLPLQTDLPVASEDRGVRGTQPVWTGVADRVQVEVRDRAEGLTLALIRPGATGATARRAAPPAPARSTAGVQARPTSAPPPTVRSRRQWGADPTWRNGRPTYNDTIEQVHLHHTASTSRYRRTDVPGIIQGMYRYHTHNLGWFDIGYNFLVDRFGRAWVGRSGGPWRAVQGAHTRGFNRNSVGIAVIGTFQSWEPKPRIALTVARLAAWKLDAYGRDPAGWVTRVSEGSDRFPAGHAVALPVVDGHLDTNETACPGDRLYAQLPVIRRRAAARAAYFS